jgi:hypothetical protein
MKTITGATLAANLCGPENIWVNDASNAFPDPYGPLGLGL